MARARTLPAFGDLVGRIVQSKPHEMRSVDRWRPVR
jgi:hypothetical protein